MFLKAPAMESRIFFWKLRNALWFKVDVSVNFWDGEHQFFEMKETCILSCVKMFFRWFIRKSVFIWKIINLTVENSENVVKSGCFEKRCDVDVCDEEH